MHAEIHISAGQQCAGGILPPSGDEPGPDARPKQMAHLDGDLPLVHASQAGDERAFEELVRRHERRLLRFALNVLHNREDAEEAIQEVFLKVFRNLSRFQENAKFSSWLFRIALNECLIKLRSRGKAQRVSLDGDLHAGGDNKPMEIADWGPNPEERYTAEELRAILGKCLQSLSPSILAVFQLRDVEQLSTEETARILEISIPAVKTRLFRARLQLRDKLNDYFGNAATSR